MIIIGLLLLIVAAIVGLDIVWKNTFQVPDVVLFGQTLGIHSARVFLLAGIIVGAVLMLGIALILGGIRRKGSKALQRRRERKQDQSAGRGRTEGVATAGERHPERAEDPRDTRPRDNVARTGTGSAGSTEQSRIPDESR